MSAIVVLDSGLLGLITNPGGSPIARECNRWLRNLVAQRVQVKLPEIADYEVRRELLRINKVTSIRRLFK